MQYESDPVMQQPAQAGAVQVSNPGILAHCQRTAALANLIAHHLFLPSEEKALLRTACLLHHSGAGLLSPRSMERLLADLGGKGEVATDGIDPVPDTVRGVLNALDVPGSGTPLELRLAGILRLSDAFDQQMEAQPIDDTGVGQILERMYVGVPAGLWAEDIMAALVESTRSTPMGEPESWHIPVFPQAAVRMLSVMRDPLAGVAQVVEAASLDPATAGLVIQLANSALFGSRTQVSTLAQAIRRLGLVNAQRVATSACLRPLFTSPKLEGLWPHSLEVADLSQQLACASGMIEPAEAYLAGLLHDVGRMALLLAPLYDSARLHGLVSGGCPPVYAEELLLRKDHAEFGAQIAGQWRLPVAMVSAIRQHHRPERAPSLLAYTLYLAEYLSGAEEDLPSRIRLETALRETRLQWGDIRDRRVSALVSWLAAA
jgi:putative nucleotidyltransferase with HDIG domain